MKRKEENNKFMVTTILMMILVVVLTVGVSYALFQFSKKGDEQRIETGTFTITFNNDARIYMLDTQPMSDTDAYALVGDDNISSYTLTNTGTIPMQYRVLLVPMAISEIKNTLGITYDPRMLSENYLKYSIVGKGDTPVSGATFLNNTERIEANGAFIGYKLDSGVLTTGNSGSASTSKDIRMWIDENTPTTETAGRTYGFKIQVQVLQQGTGISWQDYVY